MLIIAGKEEPRSAGSDSYKTFAADHGQGPTSNSGSQGLWIAPSR